MQLSNLMSVSIGMYCKLLLPYVMTALCKLELHNLIALEE